MKKRVLSLLLVLSMIFSLVVPAYADGEQQAGEGMEPNEAGEVVDNSDGGSDLLEEEDPPVNDEQDPPANDEQDPPANDEQDPPANDEQDPPANDEQDPPENGEPEGGALRGSPKGTRGVEEGGSESYTLTYDANGGYLFDDPNETSKSIVTTSLELSSEIVVHNSNKGLVRNGWYLDRDCLDGPVTEVPLSYVVDGCATVYAGWRAVPSVTAGSSSVHVQAYTESCYRFQPTESGLYQFTFSVGAFVEAQLYAADSSVLAGDNNWGDLTLRYYCEAGTVYYLGVTCYDALDVSVTIEHIADYHTVTFDSNGGTFRYEDQSMSQIVVYVVPGDAVERDYSVVSRDPDMFADGWRVNDPVNGQIVDSYDYVPEGDVVLYANLVPAYVITFDCNGGMFGKGMTVTTVQDVYVRQGESYEIPGYMTPLHLTNRNLEFSGWYADPDCSELVAPPEGGSITPTQNTTLYAGYSLAYTVVFHANGGYLFEDPNFTTDSCGYDIPTEIFGIHAYNADPRMIFDGWTTAPDGTDIVLAEGDYLYVDSDTELYAKWTSGYLITFDTIDGYLIDFNNQVSATIAVRPGETVGMNPLAEGDGDRHLVCWGLTPTFSREEQVWPYNYVPTGDTTFYALLERSYIITFDGNGGIFRYSDMEGDYTLRLAYRWYESDPACSADFGFENGSKVFAGWCWDTDCEQLAYEPDSMIVPNSDMTLYAKWVEPANIITITLDANGGFFFGDPNETYIEQSFAEGVSVANISFGAMNSEPAMRFVGWYLDPACEVPAGTEDQPYYPVGGETLYAKWLRFHVVTFNGNGGYFYDSEEMPSVISYATPGDVLGSSYRATPAMMDLSQAFAGWTDAQGNDVDLDSFTPSGDTTLYAKWGDGWIVTFDANGGWFYGDQSKPYRQISVLKGTRVGLIETYMMQHPQEGYRPENFWSYNPDGSGSRVYPEWFTPTSDVTLYALWSRYYNVTFDANGGFFGGNPNNTTSLGYYSSVYGFNYGPEGSMLGNDRAMIEAWYYDTDFEDLAFVQGGDELFCPTEDTTLYAKWTQGYVVTFNANGGVLYDDPSQTTFVKMVKSGYQVKDIPYMISEDGSSEADGWYIDDPVNGQYISNDDLYLYVPQGDITLYAKYVEKCKVTLDANGGYFWDDPQITTNELRFVAGTELYFDNYSVTHSDPSMALEGWYYDDTCQELAIGWGKSYVLGYQNDTLYAKWVQGVSVTFDANGGRLYGDENGPATATITYAAGAPLGYNWPGVYIADETKTFDGYSLTRDGSSGIIRDLSSFVPEADTTLYAQFVDCARITLYANGGYFMGDPDVVSYSSKERLGLYYEPTRAFPLSHSDAHMAVEGWYYDPDCIDFAYGPNDYFIVTGNVTLYAKWAAGYIVTLDANGGYFWNDTQRSQIEFTVAPGSTVGYNFNLQNTTDHLDWSRDWYFSSECSGEGVALDRFVPTGDITLYAKWESVYYVTLNACGGYFWNDPSSTVASGPIRCGESLSPSNYFSIPRNPDANMALEGWYFDPEYNNLAASVDGSFVPNGDVTLYAKWIQGYRITINGNGGYFNGNPNLTEYVVSVAPGERFRRNYSMAHPTDHMTADSRLYVNSDCSDEGIETWNFVPTGDMTLYVKWVRCYYVTLDANGGYFWDPAEKSAVAEIPCGTGLNPTYYFSTPENSDPALAIAGWCTDLECNNLAIDANGFFVPTGDVTLYAKWAPFVTVTLDANGGYFWDDPTTTQLTQKVALGSSVGWNFNIQNENEGVDVAAQWYFNSECSGESVDLETYCPTGEVTLYAKWVHVYRVTLDANGGYFWNQPSQTKATAGIECGTGMEVNAYFGTPKHSDARMALEGWYYDDTFHDFATNGIDRFVPTGNVTLYAKWAQGYLVTLDANGGYFNDDPETLQWTIPVAPGNSVGYDYQIGNENVHLDCSWDWYFNADCSGASVELDSYVPTGDVTLYAKWFPCYILSLYVDDGYFDQPGMKHVVGKIACNDRIDPTVVFGRPLHADPHMAVEGWYYDDACTQLAAKAGETVEMTGDMTLYAKWTQGFIVTLDANGGYFRGNLRWNQETFTVAPGNTVPYYFWLQHEGDHIDYHNEWYFNAECSGRSVNLDEYSPTEDVTLYAKWDSVYIVTLDANGGWFGDNQNETAWDAWVFEGDRLYPSAHFGLPNHSNPRMALEGWYYDDTCTQQAASGYSGYFVPTEDTTLYAKWEEGWLVTFDFCGAVEDGMESYTYVAAKGQPLGFNYVLEREGYEQGGWYLEPDFSGEPIDLKSFVPTEDVTLYVKWYRLHTVTLDANGGSFPGGEEIISFSARDGEPVGYEKYVLNDDPQLALAGWCVDADCTDSANTLSDFVVTYDVTLYAKWVSAPVLQLELDGARFDYYEVVTANAVVVNADGSTEGIDDPDNSYLTMRLLYSDGTEVPNYIVQGDRGLSAECHFPLSDPDMERGTYTILASKTLGSTILSCAKQFYYTGYKEIVHDYTGVSLSLEIDPEFIGEEERITFRATVTDADGNPVDGVKVVFRVFDELGNELPEEVLFLNNLTHGGGTCVIGAAFTEDEITPAGKYMVRAWIDDCPEIEDSGFFNFNLCYTVTFDANGGYFGGDQTQYVVKVPVGETISDIPWANNDDPAMEFNGEWMLSTDEDAQNVDVYSLVPTGDMTLYARWHRNFAVTLVANGGYFDNDPSATVKTIYTNNYGYGVNFRFSRPMHTDAHMALEGWYCDSDLTIPAWTDPEDFYSPTEDVTLYAKWTEGWTVTFDFNGGTQDGKTSAAFAVEKGEMIGGETPYPFNEQTETSLAGWYLTPDCSGRKIVNPEYYVPESDVTLYAGYEKKYEITFDANGGYFWDENETIRVQEEYSDTLYFQNCYDIQNADVHQAFVGWYLDSECEHVALDRDHKQYPLDGDLTLYAKWADAYVVSFDGNGGVCAWDDRETQSSAVPIGEALFEFPPQISIDDEHLEYNGKWTDPDGNVIDVYNGDSYVPTEDVTLTIVWESACILTLDANGGFFGDDPTAMTMKVAAGTTLRESFDPPIKPRANERGKVFDCWCYDAAGTRRVDNPAALTITSDLTLYARYTDACRVRYYYDGQVGSDFDVKKGSYLWEDGRYYGSAILNGRWYLDSELTQPVNLHTYRIDSDVCFYTSQNRENMVRVILDYDGGDFFDQSGSGFLDRWARNSLWMSKGSNIIDGAIFFPSVTDYANYLKDGQAMVGWVTERGGTESVDLYAPVYEDITIYARWVDGVRVTFDGNGTAFSRRSVDGSAYSYDLVIPAGETLDDYLNIGSFGDAFTDGPVIGGWCFDSACTQPVPAGYVPEDGLTIYADWCEDYYRVDFDIGNSGAYTLGLDCAYVVPGRALLYAPELEIDDDSFVFVGWSTDLDGEHMIGEPLAYCPTGDMTLYAQFSKGFTVYLDPNGELFDGDTSYLKVNVEAGKTLRVGELNNGAGRTVQSWYFDAACTQPVPENYVPTENITLFAKWSDAWTVTFDGGGYGRVVANGKSGACVSVIVSKGNAIGMTPSIVIPNFDGKSDTRWYLTPECDGDPVNVYSFVPEGDVTLYGKPFPYHTITFHGNGGLIDYAALGAGTDTSETLCLIVYDEEYVEIGDMGFENGTKALTGWYADEDCTALVWNRGDVVIDLPEDKEVYACWEDAWTVTFDANGGRLFDAENGPETVSVRIAKGSTISWIDVPYAYSADNKSAFNAWYRTPDFSGEPYNPYGAIPTEDLTLYAKWDKICEIKLVGNGGYFYEDPENITFTVYTTSGDVVANITPKHSSDEHMAFKGWYLDRGLRNLACAPGETYHATDDLTLYAGWEEGWLVSFDPGEYGRVIVNERFIFGENDGVVSLAVRKGDALGFTPRIVSEDGDYYRLTRWYLTSECSGENVNVAEFMPDGDVTFYGKTMPAVTCTFFGNGGTADGERIKWSDFAVGETVCWDDMGYTNGDFAFAGWYADSECTQLVFAAGESAVITENMNLFAKWAETWTVTFNANGGHLYGDPNGPETVEYKVPKGEQFPAGTWPGVYWDDQSFMGGWYLTPECDGDQIDPDTLFPESDMVLYAKRIDKRPPTLETVVVGGNVWNAAVGEETMGVFTPAESGYYKIASRSYTDVFVSLYDADVEPIASDDDCGDNQDFRLVWYLEEGETYYIGVGTLDPAAAGEVPFTVEKIAKAYRIKFNANGADTWNSEEISFYIPAGESVNCDPYVFNMDPIMIKAGWHLNKAETGRIIEDVYHFVPTASTVFYANLVDACMISLDAQGGFFFGDPESTMDRMYMAEGAEFFCDEQPQPESADPGMSFVGWYFDDTCEQLACEPGGSFTVTQSTVLHAKWIKGYLVHYDANGGYFFNDPAQTRTYLLSDTRELLSDLIPRSGDPRLVFTGWYADAACEGEPLTELSEGAFVNKEATVYAGWTAAAAAEALSAEENVIVFNGETELRRSFTPAEEGWYQFMVGGAPEGVLVSLYSADGEFLGEGPGTNFGYLSRLESGSSYYVGLKTAEPYTGTIALSIAKSASVHKVTFDGSGAAIWINDASYMTYQILVPDGYSTFVDCYVLNENGTRRGSGWYLGEPLSEELVFDTCSFVPTEDVTLYARLTDVYKIVFNANGGYYDLPEGAVTEQSRMVQDGTALEGSSMQPKNDDELLFFDGWYYDPECKLPACSRDGLYQPVKDTTLYAKWTRGFTVTFDANGEVFYQGSSNLTSFTQIVRKGDAVGSVTVLTDNANAVLDGWRVNNPTKGTIVRNLASYVPTANVTLYANWVKNCIVTIHANGGEFADTPEQSMIFTVPAGKAFYPMKLLENAGVVLFDPSEDNLAIKGWYYDEACTKLACAYNGSITPKSSVVSLEIYPKWGGTYTVVFDGNGADEGEMTPQEIALGGKTPLALNGFERVGYAFAGWNTKANGKGTAYANGAAVLNLSKTNGATVTLYAQWKAIKYKISFYANGGKGTMSAQTLTYNKAAALTANAFTRTGYSFIGWSTDPSATEVLYANKASVINLTDIPNETLALYAIWAPRNYRIVFKANGGTGDMSFDGGFCSYDQEYDLPLCSFEREGYDFVRWNTKADGKGKSYEDGATVFNLSSTNNATITLYAIWTPHHYSIAFHANAEDATGTMKNMTKLACGKSYALTANAFKRAGYSFAGWSVDPNSDEVMFKNKASKTNFTSEDGAVLDLYAVWKPVVYTISYKNVVAADMNENPATYTVEDAVDLVAPMEPRPGCTFLYWCSDSKLSKRVDSINEGTTGNKTLYAKWRVEEKITYTISFDSGAENATGTTKPMTKRVVGTAYTLTANSFKRAGYSFVGWSLMPEGNVVYANKAKNVSFTEDTTLYAVWMPVVYKITYLNVTATLLENDNNPTTYTVEETVVLSDPERPGCEFGGWYSDSKLTKRVESINEGTTGAKTLYAKWISKVSYTIAFNKNADDAKGTMKSLTKRANGTLYTLTANAFKRTGYTFLGWSLDPDAVEPDFLNKAKVGNLADQSGEIVTLYAVWAPTVYTITYKNVSDEAMPQRLSYTVLDDFDLREPERDGYVFLGWYTDSSFKSSTLVEHIQLGTTGNKTLYAKWQLISNEG